MFPPPEFHEISFLRITATQLRQIAANKAPPTSAYLLQVARDWDARADELEATLANLKPAPIAA
jgi:hypothetical protein